MAHCRLLLFTCTVLAVIIAGWTEYRGIGLKQFWVESTLKLNWYAAWNYCAVNDMKLFTIPTDLAARNLKELIGEEYFYWTAGNALADTKSNVTNTKFVWATTGQPLSYTNWLQGQPSNKNGRDYCIQTVFPDFKWNNIDCEIELAFICEHPAPLSGRIR